MRLLVPESDESPRERLIGHADIGIDGRIGHGDGMPFGADATVQIRPGSGIIQRHHGRNIAQQPGHLRRLFRKIVHNIPKADIVRVGQILIEQAFEPRLARGGRLVDEAQVILIFKVLPLRKDHPPFLIQEGRDGMRPEAVGIVRGFHPLIFRKQRPATPQTPQDIVEIGRLLHEFRERRGIQIWAAVGHGHLQRPIFVEQDPGTDRMCPHQGIR